MHYTLINVNIKEICNTMTKKVVTKEIIKEIFALAESKKLFLVMKFPSEWQH